MRLITWLDDVARERLWGGTLLLVGSLGMAGWWGELDALLGLSGLAATAGASAIGWRWWADRLPLALSTDAAASEANGHRAFRVRVMLGRGRCLETPRATAVWCPPDGDARPLQVVGPGVDRLVGPWTVLAVDTLDVIGRGGTLQVAVEGREGGHTWTAEREWPVEQIPQGEFAATLHRTSGRVKWDLATWDVVQAE